ncbi:hypothetical protein QAD02_024009 [Eretmocerus hayati]|uniref:Uncharacterized protein n=1 Tax=Eretmocerus hayati TaxID=131215 RepID=A0ACC2PY65_9HYME|nr:hypothetical protein QAD02_024009 [Eretmocerus hayati]
MAVEGGNERAVELLLERGVNPSTSNAYHELRVLHSAITTAHNFNDFDLSTYNEILQQLLTYSNRVPVFEAVLACGSVSTLRLFAEHGVNLQSCGVSFPLHEAAKNRSHGLLQYLLSSDLFFDLDAVDDFGHTPIHVATLSGNHKNLEPLLAHGANPNVCSANGDSALLLAIENRSPESVEVLLNFGARIFEYYGGNRLSMLLMAYTTCNDDIISSVMKSVVLMESLGHPIEENELWIINRFQSLKDTYEICRAEIVSMRETVVRGLINLYDVLANYEKLVSSYQGLIHEIEARDSVEKWFPVYGQRIRYRVIQMRSRQDSISRSIPALGRILGLNPDTFHLIYSKVVSYLAWKDLYNLRNLETYVVDGSLQDLDCSSLTIDMRSMIVNHSCASESDVDMF